MLLAHLAVLLLTFTRAFNDFLYEFLLISENSLKFPNFFTEVTNSRSMAVDDQQSEDVVQNCCDRRTRT